MKKLVLYSFVAALYLLTPICVLGILGTSVSKKYEVDEAYRHIEADRKLTDEQRKIKTQQLDNEGNKLDNRITLFIICGLTTFIVATTLLVKRKTLMAVKKAAHNIALA